MGDAMAPVTVAWTAWKQTTANWDAEYCSLWAAFEAGFNAAAPPAGPSEVGQPVTGAAPVEASVMGIPVIAHKGMTPDMVALCRVPPVRVEASAGVATDVELEHDEKPERNPVAATDLDLTAWHPDFIPCTIYGDSPDGGHCQPLRDDERIIITAGQLRHMGAKPEIWPEYEEPATGRYDELVKELDTARVGGHWGELFDRAASALREAQQRIAELEAKG